MQEDRYVQTIRELLDKGCSVMSCTADGLAVALAALARPPKLIITDSQVFPTVWAKKPPESLLTSFSILFAGYKGDIDAFWAGAIARAVRDAAPADVPVTVKLRIGWDADTMTGLEVARRCADAGAALLTVHGRTRAEMYNPGIHPEEIAKIKAAVDIPVLANGDVTDAESALALLAATGCDGVAVGRGAMGNPWLFGQIAAAMECREVPPPPSLHERFRVLRRHIYDMCEDKGEYIAMQQARTHAAWYMHGLRGAATLRRACCILRTWTV